MTIEWNTVTWYSKLLAVLVFVATFAVAFYLGVLWERAQVASAPTAMPSPPPAAGGGLSAPCGGFIRNAPSCATGYHCVLTPSRPDTGGTCVAD